MVSKEEFSNDNREIEKNLHRQTERVKAQTQKMEEQEEELYGIDESINEARKYQKGMKRGFLGYIPDMIKSWFKSDDKKYKKPKNLHKEDKKKKPKPQPQPQTKNVEKVENKQDLDDLLDEINGMKKQAESFKTEAENSNKKAKELEAHFEYTKKNLEKLNKDQEKVEKKSSSMKSFIFI